MHDPAIEAARFLRAHLTEPITVQDAADHVAYSPFHLSRLFTRTLGISPVQYLAAQRFQRAKALLLADDDPVVDVCMAVGFSSVGTFTRRFVEHVGLSPSGFRRMPDVLAAGAFRAIAVGGPGTGRVQGTVSLDASGEAYVGTRPHVYVGLFDRPAARGAPSAGALLMEPGPFSLVGVPPGVWWLLAASVPPDDPLGQLLVPGMVTASHDAPVLVTDLPPDPGRPAPAYHLTLAPAPEWSAPVSVALPPLAHGYGVDAGARAAERSS
ncbi:AraC family transcriptional regulator [Luteipulveratus sp. YIM 133132]|uniref:helix-turn-helix transcriptional regulator n=1 Tax=Luteipulveratus flavus TaxID=3031728 RepID=UPI0023B044F6|nr:AraC family transcriptional regulator [Luteipulveratus sp. YIM 133132]MDE9364894.1 AraC family transcriptional regulator [Luteipulveratus sp. YIM 133132]